MQGEVTGTSGFESHFCLLSNLYMQTDINILHNLMFWNMFKSSKVKQETHTDEKGHAYLERGAGTLDLDVTPARRVPTTDRKVAGQVLVSNCPVLNGYHLGLCQENTIRISFKLLLASLCLYYMTIGSSDLEPDILSSCRDGRDLKGGLTVLGD